MAYARGAGMLYRPGQWGIDLIVPVKVVLLDDATAPKYSCIVLQVKSVKAVSAAMQTDYLAKLPLKYCLPELAEDEFVASNFVAFYLNLGSEHVAAPALTAGGPSTRTRSGAGATRLLRGMCMSGLDVSVFPFLQRMPATLQAFQLLLGKGSDPAWACDDEEVGRLELMTPLVYESLSS